MTGPDQASSPEPNNSQGAPVSPEELAGIGEAAARLNLLPAGRRDAALIRNFYLAGPTVGMLLAVGVAYALRGPGRDTTAIRAAQGTLS